MAHPVVLIILDGWGEGKKEEGNASLGANTPTLDSLKNYPSTLLGASEVHVGLEEGAIGSSEVGHLTIGAGRVIKQTPVRIEEAITSGTFQENEAFLSVIKHCSAKGTDLHLMGLMSDSGVHAQMKHAILLLKMARAAGISRTWIHWIGDGRDAPPTSGKHYLSMFEKELRTLSYGTIASVSGRFYAMDRDTNWKRTQKAYDAIVHGKGAKIPSARDCIEESYRKDITDEFIEPSVIGTYSGMQEDDGVIFFNYRADRARQFTKALTEEDFSDFMRVERKQVAFASMAKFYEEQSTAVAFPPEKYENILPEVLATHGFKQLHAAETEKYAHVTYFFNGGEEKTFTGEDRILVPSPKVTTYDQRPEMSAYELTDSIVHRLATGEYDFTVINFANPDMVGHTGNYHAAVRALEVVDECVKKILDVALENNSVVMITADHGNCEHMLDGGMPHTSHTLNLVPFHLVTPENSKWRKAKLLKGSLANIAPTVLEVMEIEKPKEMGKSLFT